MSTILDGIVDFNNLSFNTITDSIARVPPNNLSFITESIARVPPPSPQIPSPASSPANTFIPISPVPVHSSPNLSPKISPQISPKFNVDGSMYGQSFANENENKQFNLRRHLLKSYMSRLGTQNDEIANLINNVIDVHRIENMTDDDIKRALKWILTAQHILDDGSEYSVMIHMIKLFMERLEQIFNKRYPKKKHISTIIAYNFKQTINRVRQMKNRNMDKLVTIASTDFDNNNNTYAINSLSHIVGRGLFTAIIHASVFGLLEYFDSKCDGKCDKTDKATMHLLKRGDREGEGDREMYKRKKRWKKRNENNKRQIYKENVNVDIDSNSTSSGNSSRDTEKSKRRRLGEINSPGSSTGTNR